MAVVVVLFIMSIFMLFDLNSFNSIFDWVVPLYSILAVAGFLFFFKTFRNSDVEDGDIDHRKFEFKKKSKMENLTWKQKFFGEFVKSERIGLAEVSNPTSHSASDKN